MSAFFKVVGCLILAVGVVSAGLLLGLLLDLIVITIQTLTIIGITTFIIAFLIYCYIDEFKGQKNQ